MSIEIQKHDNGAAIMERVLVVGDLSKLTPAERTAYYLRVCESCGLNPLTQPFQFLILNGKMVLYATKNATDQLRQIHSVSCRIVGREAQGELYIVTARASVGTREDEDVGAVVLPPRGEARANAAMKAHTKAKRRVTLSICGLSMLDESEIEAIPGAQRVEVDLATGEVLPSALQAPLPPSDDLVVSDLFDQLASAEDGHAIDRIAKAAGAALKAGQITTEDLRELAEAGQARRRDLKRRPKREPGDDSEEVAP